MKQSALINSSTPHEAVWEQIPKSILIKLFEEEVDELLTQRKRYQMKQTEPRYH